jgi:hypothetical protein
MFIRCSIVIAAALTLAGCASHRPNGIASADDSVDPKELAAAIQQLPPWPYRGQSEATDLSKYLVVAAVAQRSTDDIFLKALGQYFEMTDFKDDEDSKVFLLLRVVFDVPEDAPASELVPSKGWVNWPEPVDGRVSIAWPLSFKGEEVRLVAYSVGSMGPSYNWPGEYNRFRTKYRFRPLEKLHTQASQPTPSP